ncbi:Hypp4981 [Branchiostoma lanceolatum]|uniref:Hypp4981 protein n=1 Tax=Branchiostoma lanceolatum TaxID=7740 RepID=A0A8K0AHM0_BRALA|nr:Hypp4981 [Branchiostoma lanceolatum]
MRHVSRTPSFQCERTAESTSGSTEAMAEGWNRPIPLQWTRLCAVSRLLQQVLRLPQAGPHEVSRRDSQAQENIRSTRFPEEVISDNGPQYASEEFARFAQAWSFTHTTSSPHYPQSNGLAERTVQTIKRLLYKTRADNKDPYLALLEYRNTPVDSAIPVACTTPDGKKIAHTHPQHRRTVDAEDRQPQGRATTAREQTTTSEDLV